MKYSSPHFRAGITQHLHQPDTESCTVMSHRVFYYHLVLARRLTIFTLKKPAHNRALNNRQNFHGHRLDHSRFSLNTPQYDIVTALAFISLLAISAKYHIKTLKSPLHHENSPNFKYSSKIIWLPSNGEKLQNSSLIPSRSQIHYPISTKLYKSKINARRPDRF